MKPSHRIHVKHSLASRLSLWVTAAVAVILIILGYVMVQFVYNGVLIEAKERANDAQDDASYRVDNVLISVETAVKNSIPVIQMHRNHPDSMYAIAGRLCSNNPAISGSAVAFEPDGESIAGGGVAHARQSAIEVARVEKRAARIGAVVNVQLIVIRLKVSIDEGNCQCASVAGNEGVSEGAAAAVFAIGATRVVKTDGFSTSDGGSGIGHVDRTGATVARRGGGGSGSQCRGGTGADVILSVDDKVLSC